MPSPPDIVGDLIERFERNAETYKSPAFNETELRIEFVNPFWKALGWDMDNEAGYAMAYRDVIHEDAIKAGAPDYCFRIGGMRKFFLEAKRPAVNLKDDPAPAYQLRRYGWSAKLGISLLTDFEELAVYDCRTRPKNGDKASVGRIKLYSYKDYLEKWDEIAAVFSREAVLKGSFDKFAESTRDKRGTSEVDAEFLKDIEEWREVLAKNIALRNPALNVHELNFAVQANIDRIIFLRMCEDRGIERDVQLKALCNGPHIYPRLLEIYRKADQKYNSGLFHFDDEKDRAEAPDSITPRLEIDDKILKDIIVDLYYPQSPYEFSILPAEILGNVYEQFLGKVIRLTSEHHAKVEEKPEVRKAGGVYYTPAYIVNYIVKNTVGKLCEGKTPKEVSRLRVLDPACGSGSFLLGAYQYLLDWHLKFYLDEQKKTGTPPQSPPLEGKRKKKGDPQAIHETSKGWILTTAEKKRILLNNIYGVDIDSQAVEVTKLSLLLKVLEDESQESLQNQLLLWHERALPDLADNIKCGNSLIGPDFYSQPGEASLFADGETRERINIFDWNDPERGFGEIMKSGGFDAVIGNPPYIPIESMSDLERSYYQSHFPQLERKFDSGPVFILAMLQKLSKTGLLGFISSVTWQTGENFSKLRELLFNDAGIQTLIDLPFDVFKNAFVDTGIYILKNSRTDGYNIYRFPKKERPSQLSSVPFVYVPSNLIAGPGFKVVLDPNAYSFLRRVSSSPAFIGLGAITNSTQGLAGNCFEMMTKPKNADSYPYLIEGQARRYYLEIGEAGFTDMSDKPTLKRFYEAEPKILIRRVISRQDRLLCAFTDKKMVFKKDINPFIITDRSVDIHFLIGVLNSQLISYLYVNTSSIATKDDFRQTTLAELRSIPVPRFQTGDLRHTQIAAFSRQMLELQKDRIAANTPADQIRLDRDIAALDGQVDELVYLLYALTPDEIQLTKKVTT